MVMPMTPQQMNPMMGGAMMPMPVDKLTDQSDDKTTQDAISASIQMCMREPIPAGTNVKDSEKQKWCSGKSYGIARQKTGKPLNYGK